MAERLQNLKIENAKLIFKNFSGREKKYNPEGDRNFCVVIDDIKTVDALRDDGWNIKERADQNDPNDILYYLPVKVKFGTMPPKVVTIVGRKKSNLDEETINQLDFATIENADVIIRPYQWDINGKSGVTAYLKTLYVTLELDDFEAKYEFDDEDEELPWG